jgi:hypothetical protein
VASNAGGFQQPGEFELKLGERIGHIYRRP